MLDQPGIIELRTEYINLNGVCYNEKDQSFRITEDERERKWNFQSLSPFTVAVHSLLMNYS